MKRSSPVPASLLEIRFTRQVRDRCSAKARGLPDAWVCDAIANGREHRLAGAPDGVGRVCRFEWTIAKLDAGADGQRATLAVVGRKLERGWLALTAYLMPEEATP